MMPDTLDDPEPQKIAKGVYRHNKTGNLYEVIGVALHSETSEQVVVYRPLYESRYELYVRPFDMFVEQVKIGEKMLPRFEMIDTQNNS